MAELLTGAPNQNVQQKQALLKMLNQQNSGPALLAESAGAMGKDVASSFLGQAPTSNVKGDRTRRAMEMMELLNVEEDRGIAASDRERRIEAEDVTARDVQADRVIKAKDRVRRVDAEDITADNVKIDRARTQEDRLRLIGYVRQDRTMKEEDRQRLIKHVDEDRATTEEDRRRLIGYIEEDQVERRLESIPDYIKYEIQLGPRMDN